MAIRANIQSNWRNSTADEQARIHTKFKKCLFIMLGLDAGQASGSECQEVDRLQCTK